MNAGMAPNARAGRATTPGPGVLAGVALIAAGALLFCAQLWGLALLDWRRDWPLAVLAVGAALLAAAAFGDRRAVGLAYPGCTVAAVGAVLFVQNATGQWQTWAYAWALVAPTAVGAALWLHGLRAGRGQLRRLGRRMAEGGLLLLVLLAAFFELVVNLSRFLPGGLGATGLALLLILGGAFLLLGGRAPAEAPVR